MGGRIDMTGQKFGRLTVLEFAETRNGQAHWLCQCECNGDNSRKIVARKSLAAGQTKSCGCYNYDRITTKKKY